MSFPISPAPNEEFSFGGRIWVWDGRAWRAQANDPGSGSLADLTDVTITSPVTGEVLVWNGTEWVNQSASPITASWGSITGTLSNQTDLQTALNDRPVSVVSKTNGSGLVLTRGTAVSTDPITGNIIKANSSDTRALSFLGFVYDATIPVGAVGRVIMEGTINSSSAEWIDTTVEGSQIYVGRKYFLSDQDGKISFTAPSSGYVKQVGFGVTNLLLDIRIGPSVKIS